MPKPEIDALKRAVEAHKALIERPPLPFEPVEEIELTAAELRRERM